MSSATLKKRGLEGMVGRRAVGVSGGELVREAGPEGGGPLPVVLQPAVEGVDLAAWLESHRERVETYLRERGGILFRGFDVGSLERFEQLVRSVSGELLEYTYRSTPRTQVSGNIYTSTEYPPDQHIPLHNEMSYTASWPMKIWFYCAEPAEQGGDTPIADSRRVYRRIDPAVRERFERRKVAYIRNYGERMDLPWQDVFQTGDPAEVERFCREAGIEFEWREGGRLWTRQVCQAVAEHPRTGERVWFNQAHLFHVSSLKPEVRDALLSAFGENGLPRHATFGDGSPIPLEDLGAIRAAFREEAVPVLWQRGDVVFLDNMLVAHGRSPFSGRRKILVGMAEPAGDRVPQVQVV
jgi:alpha-ketoglutarate-dependent taurine dioxygenase